MPTEMPPSAAATPSPSVDSSRPEWGGVALLFGAALVLWLLAYLVVTVPGAWFPAASQRAWAAENLALATGTGALAGSELVVTTPDANGVTIVSGTVLFRSSDYAAIAWVAIDLPEKADVRLLWRNDYTPGKTFSVPVEIESGRPAPTLVRGHGDWIGNITGLALSIQGALPQPVRIRGVIAKPMGAFETLGDRTREWLAFENWTGTSINTITGGADLQDLPLPLLLGSAVALAGAMAYGLQRHRPRWLGLPFPAVLLALFLGASLLLDGRWTWNLARQLEATRAQYAGLDSRGKHLASDDGLLFAFIEKTRAILPAAPARVLVIADAAYFRGRAAYHLYPHNVFFDPVNNTIPPSSTLHSGDWLVVFQRRGIQYNAPEQRLRWEGGQTIAAELKLLDPLGAVFLIK